MIKDFILSNVTLEDYYEKFIKTLDKRFEAHSYLTSKLVLCFFKDHHDLNPSMGFIRSRSNPNIKMCHCFGCGRTADVVRLHQILSSQYFNKELDEKQACVELADMFGIDISNEELLAQDADYEAKFNAKMKSVNQLSKGYSIQDFKSAMQQIRSRDKVNLDLVNDECIKYIATYKHLYN